MYLFRIGSKENSMGETSYLKTNSLIRLTSTLGCILLVTASITLIVEAIYHPKPFFQVPSGPVIGKRSVHHDTMQDMRPAAMKKQFLQIYLNWRNANLTGADRKIWTWGWGSHAKDYAPGSESRAGI